MSKKLHWQNLLVLFISSWTAVIVANFCSTGSIRYSLPILCVFAMAQLFGFPFFLVVCPRSLLGLNPHGLEGSAMWTAAVVVSYLVHFVLLAGVVCFQDVAKRVLAIVAVVAFWCCAYGGLVAWAPR